MSHVKVFCTVRPLETDETLCLQPGKNPCDLVIKGETAETAFEMDGVYGGNCSQSDLFNSLVRPMITDALEGFNTTIFTYGQTGSGKTYCMQGPVSGTAGESSKGIVPRLMDNLFSHFESVQDTTSYNIRVSMMQIYQEKIHDLLCEPSNTPAPLRIREQVGGQVWVEGLIESRVEDITSFDCLNSKMLKRRAIGSHSMNAESSRSHVCILVHLNQVDIKSGARTLSKIHLIDLAGSEMVRKTDATGARLSEAKHINKSLSALGNVIYALTSPTVVGGGLSVSKMQPLSRSLGASVKSSRFPKPNSSSGAACDLNAPAPSAPSVHIPYRDSKLTRLLQDSLGGNAKTALILALNPSKLHYAESILTLRFGERARQLKTRAVRNSEPTETSLKKQLARAKQQIKSLRETISELLANPPTAAGSENESGEPFEPLVAAAGGTVPGKSTGKPSICTKNTSKINKSVKSGVAIPDKKKKVGVADVPKPDIVVPPEAPPAVIVASTLCAMCMKSLSGSDNETLPQPSACTDQSLSVDCDTAAEADGQPALKAAKSPLPPVPPPVVLSIVDNVEQHEHEMVEKQPTSASIVTTRDIEDETMIRCGVCGLNSTEAEHLQRDIGEYLGEMFSCDGNCGNQFHARCVGVVGDAGQFVAPEEGEWFCGECTIQYSSEIDERSAVADGSDKGKHSHSDGVREESFDGSVNRSLSQEVVEDISLRRSRQTRLSHNSRLVDLEEIVEDDVGAEAPATSGDESIGPGSMGTGKGSHNPIVAKIQSDYHQMRRERNRILAQWQHERKISQLLDKQRSSAQEQRDEEFVKLNHKVVLLEESLAVERSKLKAANEKESSFDMTSGEVVSLQRPKVVSSGIINASSNSRMPMGDVNPMHDDESSVAVAHEKDKLTAAAGNDNNKDTALVKNSVLSDDDDDEGGSSWTHPNVVDEPLEDTEKNNENSVRRGGVTFTRKVDKINNSAVIESTKQLDISSLQSPNTTPSDGLDLHGHVPAYVPTAAAPTTSNSSIPTSQYLQEGPVALLRPMPVLSRKSGKISAAGRITQALSSHSLLSSSNSVASPELSRDSSNNGRTDARSDDQPSADTPVTIQGRMQDLLKNVQDEAGSYAEIRKKYAHRESLRTSTASS